MLLSVIITDVVSWRDDHKGITGDQTQLYPLRCPHSFLILSQWPRQSISVVYICCQKPWPPRLELSIAGKEKCPNFWRVWFCKQIRTNRKYFPCTVLQKTFRVSVRPFLKKKKKADRLQSFFLKKKGGISNHTLTLFFSWWRIEWSDVGKVVVCVVVATGILGSVVP